MACTNNKIAKGLAGCTSNGNAKIVKTILITNYGDFSFVNGSPDAGIDTINALASPATFFKIEFDRKMATLSNTSNQDTNTGQLDTWNEDIVITLNHNDKEKRDFIESLRGVCLTALVTDGNNKTWLFGRNQGLYLTSAPRTWNNDTNNIVLTLTAEQEPESADFVLSSALVSLPIANL